MGKHQISPIILRLVAVFTSLVTVVEMQSKPEPETGLEGVISVSPVRGGPSRQGASDSRPLANTAFVVKKGNDTITLFTTDDHGTFRISLAPGHYTISRKDWGGGLGSYGPFEVDVTAGQIKKVEWNCDTGIR